MLLAINLLFYFSDIKFIQLVEINESSDIYLTIYYNLEQEHEMDEIRKHIIVKLFKFLMALQNVRILIRIFCFPLILLMSNYRNQTNNLILREVGSICNYTTCRDLLLVQIIIITLKFLGNYIYIFQGY